MIERKEKRRRRTALEIERNYPWKYEGCPKSYGSEGSLNQHMKNKHYEFYKQIWDSMGLSAGGMELSKDYNSVSGSSYKSNSRNKPKQELKERNNNDNKKNGNENENSK